MLFGLGATAWADTYHLSHIDMPGCVSTAARGINDAGQVVGTCTTKNGTRGFLYSGGAFLPVEFPEATVTSPSGIDSAGRIVGFYSLDDKFAHGFLYAQGIFSTIDVPGSVATKALAINDAGQVAGAFTDAHGEHGFLYSQGAFTTIDAPRAMATSVSGVDAAGELIGWLRDAHARVHGFRYASGAFQYLDSPRGEQLEAPGDLLYTYGAFAAIDIADAPGKLHYSGVNHAGQVVGSYLDANGSTHGFLATPDSPPILAPVAARSTSTAASVGSARPRTSSSGGACDVTGNGPVNVSDVQMMINEALGTQSTFNDLNGDHVVNIADVQIVLNAALQLGCTAGSSQGTGAVAHLNVQSGNGQVACICFSATLQVFQPISVLATDASGNPVAGATVNWTVTSGQMTVAGPSSVTDSNGIATQNINLLVINNDSSTAVPFLISTVQATANNHSFTFTETQSLVTSQGASLIEANPPQYKYQQLYGTTISSASATAITTQVAGTGLAANGVANVSVRILNNQSSPTITCSTGTNADPGSVLSDVSGNTSCSPVFSGTGSGTFYILIGGVPAANFSSALYLQAYGPFSFTSAAGGSGAPAAVQIVSGNNQVVPIGQSFSPLIARLVDANGNAVPGQTMAWSTAPAGAAALNNGSLVTDSNGEISATGTLGTLASAGVAITVALQSNPNISATFQETIPDALTAMTKASGDNQSAQAGASFANPLTIHLVTASGPAAYFVVHFNVSGPVTLDTTLAETDLNGNATVNATAGSSTGTATVTAVAGALTQTFTLTVTGSPGGGD